MPELTEADLDITNDKMIRYQNHLSEDLDYSNAYVNTMIAAVVSLYEHLQRNRFNVDANDVRVDRLHDDSERHGELQPNEAVEMGERALKQVKGQEKHCLIRMAYVTSFRIGSLLALEWTDIKYSEKDNCYLVTVLGKGKKRHTRPISKSLYEELLKIKEQDYYQRYDDNKIFHLTEKTARTMIHNLCEEIGIPDERNIVFHSLRNAAAQYIRDIGGDIEDIRLQLNHAGYGALKHYIHDNKDYANMPGLKMEQQINKEVFQELSKEQLIELILKQSEGSIYMMQKEAETMLTKQEEMKD